MTVREVIAALCHMPPDFDVRIWDAEEDDYVPVKQVLFEDGCPAVDLLPYESGERGT